MVSIICFRKEKGVYHCLVYHIDTIRLKISRNITRFRKFYIIEIKIKKAVFSIYFISLPT